MMNTLYTLNEVIEIALEQAKAGKCSEELKILYNMPYRDYVNWQDFPSWSRPNLTHDGVCYEG